MHAFEPNGLVTLTSDFGTSDGYVGAMKGVMLSISANLRLHDVGHEVPPQDLVRGAATLAAACPRFPSGTVHLAVVDPGVGTTRAAIVVVAGGHAFVAPDNGLVHDAVSALTGDEQGPTAFRIEGHPYLAPSPSRTFHGRDVFAPTAAALAAGLLPPDGVGARIAMAISPASPEPAPVGGRLGATIVREDRFGNLVTNVTSWHLTAWAGERPVVVRLPEGGVLPLVRTFSDVGHGEALAFINSDGRLELAVRDGSAGTRLGLTRGSRVAIEVDPVRRL